MSNYQDIKIGNLIEKEVNEKNIDISRICDNLKCTVDEINDLFNAESIETDKLLKLSKVLEYDFFRLYSQHLLLYAPASKSKNHNKESKLPKFRKNIYSDDVVQYMLKQIESGEKSKNQIISEYKIPKTTLYKWLKKHKINTKHSS